MLLEEFKREYESGLDVNTEHYRWRAFSLFLEENALLPSEILINLYKLGADDPDNIMGGSMMRELLNRKDCPLELIEAALQSDENFLVKAAHWALERHKKASEAP